MPSTEIHRSLIEQAAKGNAQAMKELYRLYSRAMYNVCCRIMSNRTDAEDMLQEVFIDVFAKLSSFRFESTFGAWIKRIAVNKCINELRRAKVQLEYADTHIQEPSDDADTDYEEDTTLSVERIKNAMGLLPDGYRVVFSLYMLEGYDHDEISAILNISSSTSKTQLLRAKKKLIELMRTSQEIPSIPL
ncbi:RNA polymerase sigma factor [Geofilum rhodophaeum]|uniref:RNA polymerase sigma factor n=1 Tax=Geofilum rhodophaeum TaxID=1965019 RepID=UPI00197AEE1A|nr:RNA polymerase sigma factor [Geofilum rhodophaeum]